MPESTSTSTRPPALKAWDLYPAHSPRQLYHNLVEEALTQSHALDIADEEHYIQTLDAAHLAVETLLILLSVPDTWQPILNRALAQAMPAR